MALYVSPEARWGTKTADLSVGLGQGCLVERRLDQPGAGREGQQGKL
jgi:hypothetical protein